MSESALSRLVRQSSRILEACGLGALGQRLRVHAVSLSPGDWGLRWELASALADQGDHQAAVDEYRRCLRLCPDWPQCLAALGDSLRELGRHGDAAEACETALRGDPDDARLLNNLALSLGALGRAEAAHDAFSRAVALDPSMAEAMGNLAVSAMMTGRWQDAISHGERAVAMDPSALHLRNLGDALLQSGRYADAESVLRRGAALYPDDRKINLALAMAVSELGRNTEAAGLLPDDEEPDTLATRVRVHLNADDLEAAERVARRAVSRHPDDPAAWLSLGWTLVATESGPDALEAFRQAASSDADSLSHLAGTAVALSVLGRYREARDAFSALLERDPAAMSRSAGLRKYWVQAGGAGELAPEDARSFP